MLALTVLIQLSIKFLVELHIQVVVDGDLVKLLKDQKLSIELVCLVLEMHFLFESFHYEIYFM